MRLIPDGVGENCRDNLLNFVDRRGPMRGGRPSLPVAFEGKIPVKLSPNLLNFFPQVGSDDIQVAVAGATVP